MDTIEFFVPGIPAPAGSKKAVPVFNKHTGKYVHAGNGRPIVSVMDDSSKSRPWKDRVSYFAKERFPGLPCDLPIELTLTFTMPRPKGHYRTGKNAHLLKEGSPLRHVSKPDATKLVRAVEDALTGIAWVDDSQVTTQIVAKVYGDAPGVSIRIRTGHEMESDPYFSLAPERAAEREPATPARSRSSSRTAAQPAPF